MNQDNKVHILAVGNLYDDWEKLSEYVTALRESFSTVDKEIERIGTENVSEAINKLVEIMREYQQQVLVYYPEHINEYGKALKDYFDVLSTEGFIEELRVCEEGKETDLAMYKDDHNSIMEAGSTAVSLIKSGLGTDKGLNNRIVLFDNDLVNMKTEFSDLCDALLLARSEIEAKLEVIIGDLYKDRDAIKRLQLIKESGIIKEIRTGNLNSISPEMLAMLMQGGESVTDIKLITLIGNEDYEGIFSLGANRISDYGYIALTSKLFDLYDGEAEEELLKFLNALIGNDKSEVKTYLAGLMVGQERLVDANAVLGIMCYEVQDWDMFKQTLEIEEKLFRYGGLLFGLSNMELGTIRSNSSNKVDAVWDYHIGEEVRTTYWNVDRVLSVKDINKNSIEIKVERVNYYSENGSEAKDNFKPITITNRVKYLHNDEEYNRAKDGAELWVMKEELKSMKLEIAMGAVDTILSILGLVSSSEVIETMLKYGVDMPEAGVGVVDAFLGLHEIKELKERIDIKVITNMYQSINSRGYAFQTEEDESITVTLVPPAIGDRIVIRELNENGIAPSMPKEEVDEDGVLGYIFGGSKKAVPMNNFIAEALKTDYKIEGYEKVGLYLVDGSYIDESGNVVTFESLNSERFIGSLEAVSSKCVESGICEEEFDLLKILQEKAQEIGGMR